MWNFCVTAHTYKALKRLWGAGLKIQCHCEECLPFIISFYFLSFCYRLFITPFRTFSWLRIIEFPVLLYFTVQQMLKQVCQCYLIPENTMFKCQIAQIWNSCSVLKNTVFYTSCDFWAKLIQGLSSVQQNGENWTHLTEGLGQTLASDIASVNLRFSSIKCKYAYHSSFHQSIIWISFPCSGDGKIFNGHNLETRFPIVK